MLKASQCKRPCCATVRSLLRETCSVSVHDVEPRLQAEMWTMLWQMRCVCGGLLRTCSVGGTGLTLQTLCITTWVQSGACGMRKVLAQSQSRSWSPEHPLRDPDVCGLTATQIVLFCSSLFRGLTTTGYSRTLKKDIVTYKPTLRLIWYAVTTYFT